jgi:nucleoside-diphosphate-sugar epimerase
LSERRLLVTGASGFLGAPLVARLAATGAEVHAVARSAPPDERSNLRWHAVDLADEAATRQLVDEVRPHRIYHLASLVVGRRDLDLVVPALGANLLSTVHLLAAAAERDVERIVLAGTMEEPVGDEPPSSPYSASKGAAALYARLFHELYGLPVVTARIFMVYGPGQRDRTKLVPSTIASALAGEAPKISSGEREVDWIYVDDAVGGLVALGAARGLEGETLDLGTGVLTSVREVAETICRLVGSPAPEVGALRDRALEQARRADPEPLAKATGFRAEVGLEEGLARTIERSRDEAR